MCTNMNGYCAHLHTVFQHAIKTALLEESEFSCIYASAEKEYHLNSDEAIERLKKHQPLTGPAINRQGGLKIWHEEIAYLSKNRWFLFTYDNHYPCC